MDLWEQKKFTQTWYYITNSKSLTIVFFKECSYVLDLWSRKIFIYFTIHGCSCIKSFQLWMSKHLMLRSAAWQCRLRYAVRDSFGACESAYVISNYLYQVTSSWLRFSLRTSLLAGLYTQVRKESLFFPIDTSVNRGPSDKLLVTEISYNSVILYMRTYKGSIAGNLVL